MSAAVLLLNASFEPIRVVSLHKAVTMIVTDKAELVERKSGVLRSPSMSVPIPAVIALRVYVKIPYRATLPLNRRAVMVRDDSTCGYCGNPGSTIDHIIPRSRGGLHVWENVVCACRPCNSKKDDKTLTELAWERPPTPVPKGWKWLVLGWGVPDPAWTPYLTMVEV
jgi:5-methylcytosine-specific restriction endonuclease McrA